MSPDRRLPPVRAADDSRRRRGRSRWLWAAVASGLALVTVGAPRARSSSESERLAAALALRPGMTVADVGAGEGEWTEDLARRVGEAGHVYATEVEQAKLDGIAQRVSKAGLANVTTVLGDQEDTGLPPGCCDAILLRLVYHHFTQPAKMRASLARALRPNARLVVVDTAPRAGWRDLPGVPERGGHGIEPEALIAEMAAHGFEVLEQLDWPDGQAQYCVVFRRTLGGPRAPPPPATRAGSQPAPPGAGPAPR